MYKDSIRLEYFFSNQDDYINKNNIFNKILFYSNSGRSKENARINGLILKFVGNIMDISFSVGSIYDYRYYIDFSFLSRREFDFQYDSYIEEVTYNG